MAAIANHPTEVVDYQKINLYNSTQSTNYISLFEPNLDRHTVNNLKQFDSDNLFAFHYNHFISQFNQRESKLLFSDKKNIQERVKLVLSYALEFNPSKFKIEISNDNSAVITLLKGSKIVFIEQYFHSQDDELYVNVYDNNEKEHLTDFDGPFSKFKSFFKSNI